MDKYAKTSFESYIRYVDDILIFTESEDGLSELVKVTSSLGLEFNEKSEKKTIKDKFEFLGYHFHAGLLSPKQESQERFLTQIFKIIKDPKEETRRHTHSGRSLSDDDLVKAIIFKINFKFTGAIHENRRYGWTAYFSQTTNRACFFKIQKIIENKISKKLGESILQRYPLRNLISSYYDMRHHGGARYALNYDKVSSPEQKAKFLVDMGIISNDESKTYAIDQINSIFADVIKKELKSLEVDVGYVA